MAAARLSCPGLFITGTDTGVGKTLVTAALARYCLTRGMRVGVMKPCETGVTEPAGPGDDARLLQWASGSQDDPGLIAPYRFREPLSPAQAAEREGCHIDPARLISACQDIARGKDIVLVEGAGGIMVPLRGGYLMADLARELGLPLLVVARPGLGTINHTLLTIFAARMMELPLAGFFINRMPQSPGPAEEGAPHQLAALASADLLGVIPEVFGTPQEQVEQLALVIAELMKLPWSAQALGFSNS